MKPYLDAAWNWFSLWGPILRDVASVFLGLASVVLAGLAISMGRKQGKLAEKLAELEEKQAAIVEEQHRFHIEQTSKATDLRLQASFQSRPSSMVRANSIETILQVINGGTKTADGFHWEILTHKSLGTAASFYSVEDGAVVPRKWKPIGNHSAWQELHGHYPHKLFPTTEADIVQMVVSEGAGEKFQLFWKIKTDDRVQPPSGYYILEFVKKGAFYEQRFEHKVVDPSETDN